MPHEADARTEALLTLSGRPWLTIEQKSDSIAEVRMAVPDDATGMLMQVYFERETTFDEIVAEFLQFFGAEWPNRKTFFREATGELSRSISWHSTDPIKLTVDVRQRKEDTPGA